MPVQILLIICSIIIQTQTKGDKNRRTDQVLLFAETVNSDLFEGTSLCERCNAHLAVMPTSLL